MKCEVTNGRQTLPDKYKGLSKNIFPEAFMQKIWSDTDHIYSQYLEPKGNYSLWKEAYCKSIAIILIRYSRLLLDNQTKNSFTQQLPSLMEVSIINKIGRRLGTNEFVMLPKNPVSTFLICINEFSALKTTNLFILEQFVKAFSQYSPAVSEELLLLIRQQQNLIEIAVQKKTDKKRKAIFKWLHPYYKEFKIKYF